jgi:hypothetical protein
MSSLHLYLQTDSQDITQFREDLGLRDPLYDDISAVLFVMDDEDITDAWIYSGSRPFDIDGEFEAVRASGIDLPDEQRFYTKSPQINTYFQGLCGAPGGYSAIHADLKLLAKAGITLRQRDPNVLVGEPGRFMVVDGNGSANLDASLRFVGDVAATLVERAKDMMLHSRGCQPGQ